MPTKTRKPDVCTRPMIARIPGKLGGAYHVRGTRISIRFIRNLERDGIRRRAIHWMYPQLSLAQIDAALRFRKRA